MRTVFNGAIAAVAFTVAAFTFVKADLRESASNQSRGELQNSKNLLSFEIVTLETVSETSLAI